eukprot:SAG11_NODE_254_length_11587_cov_4.312913_2_plen_68_part_00
MEEYAKSKVLDLVKASLTDDDDDQHDDEQDAPPAGRWKCIHENGVGKRMYAKEGERNGRGPDLVRPS